MMARLVWKEQSLPRPRSGRRTLRALEWTFLVAGLLAPDVFVWMTDTSLLYQSYQDWAFDQTLRGLSPNVGGFIKEEARWLWTGRSEQVPKGEVASGPETKADEARSNPPGGEV